MPTKLFDYILLIAEEHQKISDNVNDEIFFKKIFLVNSWNEAEKILKNEKIDVIITDLSLVDINEETLLEKLKDINIVKIVVINNKHHNLDLIKEFVDDFIHCEDLNEENIKKAIINALRIKSINKLKHKIKNTLATIPNKIGA